MSDSGLLAILYLLVALVGFVAAYWPIILIAAVAAVVIRRKAKPDEQ